MRWLSVARSSSRPSASQVLRCLALAKDWVVSTAATPVTPATARSTFSVSSPAGTAAVTVRPSS